MAKSDAQKKAQAAWNRIEALGGYGVWESDMVVVSFDKAKVTDDDLTLFRDFPFVQILSLNDTAISDKGLEHLQNLPDLQSLSLIRTKVTTNAINALKQAHPNVDISNEPAPKGALNPFTGKPF